MILRNWLCRKKKMFWTLISSSFDHLFLCWAFYSGAKFSRWSPKFSQWCWGCELESKALKKHVKRPTSALPLGLSQVFVWHKMYLEIGWLLFFFALSSTWDYFFFFNVDKAAASYFYQSLKKIKKITTPLLSLPDQAQTFSISCAAQLFGHEPKKSLS